MLASKTKAPQLSQGSELQNQGHTVNQASVKTQPTQDGIRINKANQDDIVSHLKDRPNLSASETAVNALETAAQTSVSHECTSGSESIPEYRIRDPDSMMRASALTTPVIDSTQITGIRTVDHSFADNGRNSVELRTSESVPSMKESGKPSNNHFED
jgi:hypothetical protein